MPEISQVAANLNLRFYHKYPFGFTLDFPGMDLTGYQLEAYVQDHHGNRVVDFTIARIPFRPGYLSFTLSETDSQRLSSKTSYNWVFNWVPPAGTIRRVVAGKVVLI